MTYNATITLTSKEYTLLRECKAYVGPHPNFRHGDTIINHTATFENGVEVDIKLVSSDSPEGPWSEMVLFAPPLDKRGGMAEIACSEVGDTSDFISDEWALFANGDEYHVVVEAPRSS